MKTADPCVLPAICAADGMWCSVMWVVRCDVCVCVQVDLFSRTVESLDCYTNRNALVITTARCACCCHPFFRHFLACKFHPAYSHTTGTMKLLRPTLHIFVYSTVYVQSLWKFLNFSINWYRTIIFLGTDSGRLYTSIQCYRNMKQNSNSVSSGSKKLMEKCKQWAKRFFWHLHAWTVNTSVQHKSANEWNHNIGIFCCTRPHTHIERCYYIVILVLLAISIEMCFLAVRVRVHGTCIFAYVQSSLFIECSFWIFHSFNSRFLSIYHSILAVLVFCRFVRHVFQQTLFWWSISKDKCTWSHANR